MLMVCQALFQAPVIHESTEYLQKPYELGGLSEAREGQQLAAGPRAARCIASWFDPKPLGHLLPTAPIGLNLRRMPAASEMLWLIGELCGHHGVPIQGPWTLFSGWLGGPSGCIWSDNIA